MSVVQEPAPPVAAAPSRLARRVAPLSFAQERLWFIDAAAPGDATYNVPLLVQWTERVERDALARALGAVATRHEVLRTTYRLDGGRPVQIAADPAPVRVEVRRAADRRQARAQAEQLAREGFDLAAAAPLRCVLWQGLAGGDLMLLNVHHIAIDGWSLAALFEDLAAAYDAVIAGRAPQLPEPALQYADFAAWDRAEGETPAARRRHDARLAELLDVPGELELCGARPRPAGVGRARRGAEHAFSIPDELWSAVQELATALRCTPFVVLLAAYQAVLARWSGRDRFLVATATANRPFAALEPLVGFFVNTVPLRCAPRSQQTFAELCAGVRGEAFGALSHQRIPYDQLAAGARAARPGGGDLVDVGFALQNMPAARIAAPRWQPPELLATQTAKFDLFLIFDVRADGLAGTIEYDVDRYSADVAAELARNVLALLTAAVADPQRPVGCLPVSSAQPGEPRSGVLAGQRRDLVREGLGAGARATSVVDVIAARVALADPAATAVTCAGTDLSWHELDSLSAAIASRLAQRGIGAGDYVPVVAARGGALAAAWLAVLRRGAAFVPMSLDTPPNRLAHVVEHVRASVVLADADGAALLGGVDVDRVAIDGPLPAASCAPDVALTGAEPAVVIYTSGTTGRPKGVVVPHRGLLNTVLWWGRDARLTAADRVLCAWSTSFDAATFDVFRTLAAGASVLFADDVQRRDPAALLRLLRGPRAATVASMTPSLLRALLDADEGGEPIASRLLYLGGEALPHALAERCAARWGIPMRNIYGPTETSCIATGAPVDPADPRPPIGLPLPNTRAYVLGPDREELPAGVRGELYLAGRGVGLGYLDAPELTAAAFVADPYEPDARMYRTGDVAVVRPDGLLECLGRVDDQVKVLGHRIETTDVASLLAEHPAVRAAAVQAAGEPARLIGYVELADGAAPPTRADVVAPLLRWLPPAVLPAEVYVVDGLPLTGNDKTNFAALAGMRDRALPEGPPARVRPLTAAERQAAERFRAALDEIDRPAGTPAVESLDPDTSFFALGGHSLLSVRMLAAAQRDVGARVALRDFLADPTIAGLARLLANAPAARADVRPGGADGDTSPDDAWHEATATQQRLWLVDRLGDLRSSYLVPIVLEIAGGVERETLRGAIARVLGRHPALRSRFELDRRTRRVRYRTDGDPPAAILTDAAGWSADDLAQRIAGACWTPFDLAAGPPARAEVLACDGDRTVVVLTAHHIVTDGWSVGLLLDEVAEAYDAARRGRPARLAAPVHPARVARPPAAAWLDAAIAESIDALRGAPVDVELPRTGRRPALQATAAATAAATLAPDLTARLRSLGAQLGCTTFMTSAALLGGALARLGSQRDFLLAFPWAGRDAPGAAGAVGMFVDTLVLRVDLRGAPTWRELLLRVRAESLRSYRNAAVPFDALAAALHPERDLSRPPLTPVYFAVQEREPAPPRLGPGVAVRFAELPSLRVKYELELTVCDGPGGIALRASYARDLIDASTVDDLLAALAAGARDLAADLDAPAIKETA
ncbi:MAG: hypothetical protein QOG56_173 [Solirubrobacteraceae bacterium]|nr:hypothetical protein [Solirubrobacteraceae bacterium]